MSIFAMKIMPASALFLVLSAMVLAGCGSGTTEGYLAAAESNIDELDYRSAIINLKNALQQDGENARARYLLGKSYVEMGDGVGAEKELMLARQLGFNSTEMSILRGRAFLMQGKADDLLSELSVSTGDSEAAQVEILVLRSQAYLIKDDPVQAQIAINQALKLAPDSVDAILGKARVQIVDGKSAEADQSIEQALKLQPNSFPAWLMKADMALSNNDFSAAKHAYEQALAADQQSTAALLGYAHANTAMGDSDAALRAVGTILKSFPGQPVANYIKATIDYQRGEFDSAENALLQTTKAFPNHPQVNQLQGAIHFVRGRYEQANVSLTRALAMAPRNVDIIKLLAATRIKLGEPASAIEYLESIAAENNDDAQFLAMLGSAYLQMHQNQQGMELLERALKIAPDAASIHTQLALGQLASGKTGKAITSLKSAVKLDQDVFQADVLLVLAHLRSKKFGEALEAAHQLITKLPDSPVPYMLMGATQVEMGDAESARRSFAKAIEIQPDYFPAHMSLARIDERRGDIDAASKQLNKLLDIDKNNVNALLALADLEERRHQRSASAAYIERAWAVNQGDREVGLRLIQHWLSRQQAQQAMVIAETLRNRFPADYAVMKSFGTVQLAAGQAEAALETFTHLAERNADRVEAHFLVGRTYQIMGDSGHARDYLARAISLDDLFLPAQLSLAEVEFNSDRPDKAFAIARNIQKRQPASPIGYQLEGDLYMQQEKFKAAAKAYVLGYGKIANGALARGVYRAEARMGPPVQAVKLLSDWVEGHPDDIEIRLVYAEALQSRGDNANAIMHYQAVLAINPQQVTALNNLAWLYHEQGNAEAMLYARRAYDIAADNPAVADTYGWLLVEFGQAGQGLEPLRKARDAAPHIPAIRYHYAMALASIQHEDKAIAELEDLLAKYKQFAEIEQARALLRRLKPS